MGKIILFPFVVGALGLVEYWQMLDKGWAEHEIRNMMIFFVVLFALPFPVMLFQYFARLRFAPDGIALELLE